MRALPCRMDGETEGSLALGGSCQWGHLHLENNKKTTKYGVFFRVLYCDFSVTNFYLCPKHHMLCPISIFHFLYFFIALIYLF